MNATKNSADGTKKYKIDAAIILCNVGLAQDIIDVAFDSTTAHIKGVLGIEGSIEGDKHSHIRELSHIVGLVSLPGGGKELGLEQSEMLLGQGYLLEHELFAHLVRVAHAAGLEMRESEGIGDLKIDGARKDYKIHMDGLRGMYKHALQELDDRPLPPLLCLKPGYELECDSSDIDGVEVDSSFRVRVESETTVSAGVQFDSSFSGRVECSPSGTTPLLYSLDPQLGLRVETAKEDLIMRVRDIMDNPSEEIRRLIPSDVQEVVITCLVNVALTKSAMYLLILESLPNTGPVIDMPIDFLLNYEFFATASYKPGYKKKLYPNLEEKYPWFTSVVEAVCGVKEEIVRKAISLGYLDPEEGRSEDSEKLVCDYQDENLNVHDDLSKLPDCVTSSNEEPKLQAGQPFDMHEHIKPKLAAEYEEEFIESGSDYIFSESEEELGEFKKEIKGSSYNVISPGTEKKYSENSNFHTDQEEVEECTYSSCDTSLDARKEMLIKADEGIDLEELDEGLEIHFSSDFSQNREQMEQFEKWWNMPPESEHTKKRAKAGCGVGIASVKRIGHSVEEYAIPLFTLTGVAVSVGVAVKQLVIPSL